MDFDDLLMYPYLMFRQYPKILEKRQTLFQYILVDEAQDTNWIQFELMKQLSKNTSSPSLLLSEKGDHKTLPKEGEPSLKGEGGAAG